MLGRQPPCQVVSCSGPCNRSSIRRQNPRSKDKVKMRGTGIGNVKGVNDRTEVGAEETHAAATMKGIASSQEDCRIGARWGGTSWVGKGGAAGGGGGGVRTHKGAGGGMRQRGCWHTFKWVGAWGRGAVGSTGYGSVSCEQVSVGLGSEGPGGGRRCVVQPAGRRRRAEAGGAARALP